MPQIRSGSVVTAATAAPGYQITVPKPPGLANGDLIIVSLGAQTDSVAATGWAWAVVGTTPAFQADVAASRTSTWNINGQTLRRYVTDAATEPADYTFATGANTTANISAAACAVIGADPTTPIDVLGSQGNETSLRLYAPSITTVTAGCLLMATGVSERNVSHNPPVEMTELAQVYSTGGAGTNTISTTSLHVENALQAAAGATGERIGSIGGTTNRDTHTQLFAIRPAGGTANPKISTFRENFDEVSEWTLTAGASATLGELTMPAPAVASYASAATNGKFDLTESAFGVEVREFMVGSSVETFVTAYLAGTNDRVQIYKADANLIVRKVVGGAATTISITAYDATMMKAWGFAESGGTMTARVSQDGETWTALGPSFATPFAVTGINVALESGYWDTTKDGTVTGTTRFDNLNLLVGGGTPEEPANAGPDQIVAADTTVTLIGTPAGGTWSQDSGDPVVFSEPLTSATDTRITFVAKNTSTSTNSVRVFRYTTGLDNNVVQVTPEANQWTDAKASLTTTLPAVATVGNLLIASLTVDKDTAGTIVPPTGFTLIQDYRASSVSGAMAYRVADGTEKTIGEWTWATGTSRRNTASTQEYDLKSAALAGSFLSADNETAVSKISGSVANGTFVVGQVGVDTANGTWGADDPAFVGLSKVLRVGGDAADTTTGAPGMAVGITNKTVGSTHPVDATASAGADQHYMILASFTGGA